MKAGRKPRVLGGEPREAGHGWAQVGEVGWAVREPSPPSRGAVRPG